MLGDLQQQEGGWVGKERLRRVPCTGSLALWQQPLGGRPWVAAAGWQHRTGPNTNTLAPWGQAATGQLRLLLLWEQVQVVGGRQQPGLLTCTTSSRRVQAMLVQV